VLDELHFRDTKTRCLLPTWKGSGTQRTLQTPLIVGNSCSRSTTTVSMCGEMRLECFASWWTTSGITSGLKIGALAECFGMECSPHGVGNVLHQAAHLHCELAIANSAFAEVRCAGGARQPALHQGQIGIGSDGYVEAPVKPGLGYEIDRAALDNLTTQVER